MCFLFFFVKYEFDVFEDVGVYCSAYAEHAFGQFFECVVSMPSLMASLSLIVVLVEPESTRNSTVAYVRSVLDSRMAVT